MMYDKKGKPIQKGDNLAYATIKAYGNPQLEIVEVIDVFPKKRPPYVLVIMESGRKNRLYDVGRTLVL